MASSIFQITYVQWFYLLNSSKFPFKPTMPKTIPFIILRKTKNGNVSCSPHSGYCGKAWHFHHPANTGALLKCGQTKEGATEHSLTACWSYLGWQQALTDWAEPLQRQDASRGAEGLPHKRCYFTMPIRTQLSSSSRNLSQANVYTYQRRPKTIRFFWRQMS